MEISRRSLLGASAVVGAGVLLPLKTPTAANAAVPLDHRPPRHPAPPSPLVPPFTESLPTLTEMGVIDATRGHNATIKMVNATHAFSKTISTPTFAYQSKGGHQTLLGPVIIARRNVGFKLTVVNDLGDHPVAKAIDTGIMGAQESDRTAPRAVVHLHGGNTAAASDGDPLDWYRPGSSKTHQYDNTQEAAGLWYHDHALGITRLNVFAGLAGGYLIRDDNDPGDGSRLPAPPYEVPLVFQDRSFNPDGTLLYPLSDAPPAGLQSWIPEYFGDVATVNGKIQPNLNVRRGKYRFRTYNGSNARFYNFTFMSGGVALKFFQIGTDGGLLDNPVSMPSLLLAPGERADLVVDFECLPVGTKVILTNDAPTPFPAGDANKLDKIMQFTVTRAPGWTKRLTTRTSLRSRTAPITRLQDRTVDETRNMTMVEVHDSADNPTMVLMNNRNFMSMVDGMPMEPMDMKAVKSNTLEEWVLINTTVDAHPMHLHFTQFQIINREKFTPTTADGQDSVEAYSVRAGYLDPTTLQSTGAGSAATIFPPPDVTPYLDGNPTKPFPNEMGWKDTIVCMPGEVTRIRVPFGPKAVPLPKRWGRERYLPMAIGAAHTGPYVSHCHILEHEENDMMMRFTIE